MQQATSNKQQATSNKQQATSNKQQATSNKQQATSNKQQSALNHRQLRHGSSQRTGDLRSAASHKLPRAPTSSPEVPWDSPGLPECLYRPRNPHYGSNFSGRDQRLLEAPEAPGVPPNTVRWSPNTVHGSPSRCTGRQGSAACAEGGKFFKISRNKDRHFSWTDFDEALQK